MSARPANAATTEGTAGRPSMGMVSWWRRLAGIRYCHGGVQILGIPAGENLARRVGAWLCEHVHGYLIRSQIHALLPIYLVAVLGTSALTVGFIEGIAEAAASITKIFSGALSDWLGKRKLLAAIGYGLAAFTKPVFPLATSVSWLVAARFIDRIGKGIRGAPRDALVADIAPAELRGASFASGSLSIPPGPSSVRWPLSA